MSLLRWVRGLFSQKPKAPPELLFVLEIRALYVAQVQSTANLEAATWSLDRQIDEHQRTVRRWEKRVQLPLPHDIRRSAQGILSRYSTYLDSAIAVRNDCARVLLVCREAEASMLSHLTRLGGLAARAGIDTSSLAVEIDLREVVQTAAERNARALIEEGICETDNEREFLERLFERGFEAN